MYKVQRDTGLSTLHLNRIFDYWPGLGLLIWEPGCMSGHKIWHRFLCLTLNSFLSNVIHKDGLHFANSACTMQIQEGIHTFKDHNHNNRLKQRVNWMLGAGRRAKGGTGVRIQNKNVRKSQPSHLSQHYTCIVTSQWTAPVFVPPPFPLPSQARTILTELVVHCPRSDERPHEPVTLSPPHLNLSTLQRDALFLVIGLAGGDRRRRNSPPPPYPPRNTGLWNGNGKVRLCSELE